jgi:hypothetical protein
MAPLIIATVLFNSYIRQEHFRVAMYLPSRECMRVDLKNGPDFDLSFTKDAYLQEELREKVSYPYALTEERARELGNVQPVIEQAQTPPYGSLLDEASLTGSLASRHREHLECDPLSGVRVDSDLIPQESTESETQLLGAYRIECPGDCADYLHGCS